MPPVEPPTPKLPPQDNEGDDGSYVNLLERVTILETKTEHLATKEDIKDVKIWALGGAIAAILAILGLAVTIIAR